MVLRAIRAASLSGETFGVIAPFWAFCYNPAMETSAIEQLADRLLELCAERGRALLALDGRCASGKTTAARRLRECLAERKLRDGRRPQTVVLHLDDFFLRPEQRTEARLRLPGENVDHERFLTEALRPLASGVAFSFRPYDCRTQTLKEPVTVPAADSGIIEGAYSCHRDLRGYYDLRVWADIDPETQRQRILGRNGEAGLQRFAELWIPLEERYFRTLGAEVFAYKLLC